MGTEAKKQVYRCFIKILSPVHIGCDEVYEPTGFSVDEEAYQLVVFDPLGFILGIEKEDRRKFSEICSKGTVASILEIYRFLQTKSVYGRRVDVCNAFPDHYRQTLSIPLNNERQIQQELNRFSIARTAFSSEDLRPYIPGSSVKGALRTGYLNELQLKKHPPGFKGKGAAQELEKRLMDYDSIPTDPFRLVKVSDFMPVGEIRTKVLYAVNEKKRPSKFSAHGPEQILEVIPPGSVFVGDITVEKPEAAAKIRNPVSMKSLIDGSARFYEKERTREERELAQIGIVPQAPDVAPHHLDDNLLLRIGRHSGAESVTIEGQRQILIRKERGNNETLDHATTFWLAAETRKPTMKQHLLPFGWAVLSPLTAELQDHLEEDEKLWKDKCQEKNELRKARAQKIADEKQEAMELARKKAEEEKVRREEQEKRKAEFEAMSPEERDIALLNDPKVTEEHVVQVFMKLEQFSETNRKNAAATLKAYWVKAGKWSKKDCSKKQWVKVQKIKAVLGDN